MMQLSRRIDLENETNIMYIRTAYLISIISAYVVYQLVKQKIANKNDQTKVEVITPKNPMKPEESEKVKIMTARDYDMDQIDQAIKGIWTGVAMMGFMHFYMKFTNPLFMQCLNPIKGALENNVSRIYLWGAKPEGDLKRPFTSPGLLDAFTKKPENKNISATTTEESNEPKIVELNDEKTTATVAAE